MEANGNWQGGFLTRLDDGRGHVITVDLPLSSAGSDAGPTALELGLMSLAGCINTIFLEVAAKRKLKFQTLSISLRGERSSRAATIERVLGTLEVQTSAPRNDVETVLRLTLRTCPIGVLFDRAGVPVDVVCSVRPLGAPPDKSDLPVRQRTPAGK